MWHKLGREETEMDDTAQRPLGLSFSKDRKPDEKGAYPQIQPFPVEKEGCLRDEYRSPVGETRSQRVTHKGVSSKGTREH